MTKLYLSLFGFLLSFCLLSAQRFDAHFGVAAQLRFVLGNQNQKIELGLSGMATLNYGDAALESGLSLSAGQLFKRHTIRQSGRFYRYDFITLVGGGKNGNLLGSSLLQSHSPLIYNHEGSNGFYGLGFGFEKEFLPKELSHFSLRRGKIMMRFSDAQHSFDITFINDFRFGRLFYGQGTDYGDTGTLRLGYTEILSPDRIIRAGVVVALFTPQPDYLRTPNNVVNSDDGRKNVWHIRPPFADTFYANLYAFGTYQYEGYSYSTKIGINSQKLGAFIQNTLHDGPGLNPRFPWKVAEKGKLYYELSGILFETVADEN